MRASEFIIETVDIIDNEEGLGQVPMNMEIDYKGFRVLMKPSTFLKLSLQRQAPRPGVVEYIVNHLRNGGKIGAPFLTINFNKDWFNGWNPYRDGNPTLEASPDNAPTVVGHEGRHRMDAILEIYGDVPVEVHIFLQTDNYSLEGRGKPKVLLDIANKYLMNQDKNRVYTGPLWTDM